MTFVAHLLSTWFGCGHFPWGPGTVGAAAAVAIAWVFHWSPGTLLAATLLAAAAGTWSGTVTARASGRKDPGLVVIDEVAGQWLTLTFATAFSPAAYLIGFALFRFFDITKPFPVRRLEALRPEGWGIMADDLGAGIYAGVCLLVLGKMGIY